MSQELRTKSVQPMLLAANCKKWENELAHNISSSVLLPVEEIPDRDSHQAQLFTKHNVKLP